MKNFFPELLKGRFLEHPVHMMLVHFPSALLPVSLIADLTAILLDENKFFTFSFFSVVAGVVFGYGALIFGIIELMKIPTDTKAFNIALTHGGLNLLWLIIFSVVVGMDIKNYPVIEPSTIILLLKVFAVSGLLFSNYLGGELVLKYGIGKKDKKNSF